MLAKNKILILAPHTDDGELGCGASIARFCREGREVFYATFSLCRKSLVPGLEPDTLEKELRSATRVLGINENNLRLFDYDVRWFPHHRQEILENLVALKKEINPDLVMVPSRNDMHQDHQVLAQEGLRAFKHSSILGYEMPWNNLTFDTETFVCVDESDLDKKIEALAEYESQKYRAYLSADFIKGLALTRGVQIGAKYAEAFEVIRWIVD